MGPTLRIICCYEVTPIFGGARAVFCVWYFFYSEALVAWIVHLDAYALPGQWAGSRGFPWEHFGSRFSFLHYRIDSLNPRLQKQGWRPHWDTVDTSVLVLMYVA
jgi:hypothetical protein